MVQSKSREQVLSQRKSVLSGAFNKHVIPAKSHRVGAIHYCTVCGKQLTAYISTENRYRCRYKHYYCHIGWITYGVCYHADSCYRELKRQGKLIE